MADDQDATVRFLSSADSYGLSGPVERIDTHAAIVFLAGDRAYKLKRAVTYPYLDYGTPALRKAACEAELRLNRRTAPDLYLDVRAVTETADGHLGFEPDRRAVDWLVVMRRFPQDCLFSSAEMQAAMTPALLRRLADRIAAFHQRAEVIERVDGAAAIRSVIDANLESMAAQRSILPMDEAVALHRSSLALLDRLAPLLDRRAREGHVRRCHGDLHLRNICLIEGEPTLFDCLEFSDALASIDVLYDLAFLLMDMWQKGLRAQANILFNRYFDMTEETDGLTALPLFMSIRAAIRSHVAAAAALLQRAKTERERQETDARAYLEAAKSYLDSRPPLLVAIGGLSGTGKSTLAQGLAPDIGQPPGARILRTDVIRKRLFDKAPEDRLGQDAYSPATDLRVYERLYVSAAAALAARHAVIVDAVFADPSERVRIEAIAETAGVPFRALWLAAPREALEARVQARSGDASDATVAVLHRQLGYDIGDLAGWHRIDAGGDAAQSRSLAARALARPQVEFANCPSPTSRHPYGP